MQGIKLPVLYGALVQMGPFLPVLGQRFSDTQACRRFTPGTPVMSLSSSSGGSVPVGPGSPGDPELPRPSASIKRSSWSGKPVGTQIMKGP